MYIGIMILLAPKVNAADLKSKAGAVTTASGALNVRNGASSASAKVAALKKGTYVTLLSKSGSWWHVEYDKGKYGYCHADYITVVEGTPVTVNTKSGNLNVRSGAGTAHSKTGTLGKGETVILLSETGEWSRVLYHGTKIGYVSAQYLSSQYPAVSLWVPNLKQADERWANTIIGSSGKTIAQIGCATSAIAMVESHRVGRTIYPDEMASRLRYTPTGSVYWPEHFTAVTEVGNYLEKVYQLLKQGKPVLLGAVNNYGSQHWVVVTGFVGGRNLSSSGFTIQDPGTWSRTNLQQFLNAYPKIYKFFFY